MADIRTELREIREALQEQHAQKHTTWYRGEFSDRAWSRLWDLKLKADRGCGVFTMSPKFWGEECARALQHHRRCIATGRSEATIEKYARDAYLCARSAAQVWMGRTMQAQARAMWP